MKSMFKKVATVVTAFSMISGVALSAGTPKESNAAEVKIDSSVIQDTDLYQFMTNADTNNDGILSDAEAAAVKSLYFTTEKSDVTSILAYFPNVNYIDVRTGSNKAITVNSKKITTIETRGQYPVAFKGAAPSTAICHISGNQSSLDFSKLEGYKNVVNFYLYESKASKIKAPNAAKLKKLTLAASKLTSIDTSKYKSVEQLVLDGNYLKKLNTKKNTKLTSLSCYNNKLTSLNIASNKKLKDVGVGSNKLKKIDISKNKKMTKVTAYSNKLKSLQSKKSKKIVDINVAENKLTSFDASKYPNLKSLMINDNKIKTLDLGKNKKINSLSISNTPLKKLTLGSKAFNYAGFGEHNNFLKKVKKINNNGFVSIKATSKNATYNLPKLIPALKGYTFTSYDTPSSITANGVVKLAAPSKNGFISVTAKKGSSSVMIYFTGK